MRVRMLIAFKAGLAMLALLAWVTVTPSQIQAQVAGASLSGTVNDTSGAPLAGAKVTIENLATGVSREAATDTNGFYTAPNLLPGTYEVGVSAPGFATQVRKGITLTVGGQATINFTMRVGMVNEKIEVTEAAPVVQMSSSDISAVVNSTTVRELPLNGRSWTDLATLQPGVTHIDSAFNAAAGADRGERGFGTQLSISGGKPVQNNYRLDGVSVVDFANGAPGSVLGASLGVDAIQEFSVITTNYSADYGRTSGGVVNAITRSGTNTFHGSAFEFLRNSALDARNYFDYDANGNPIRSPFKRNQFGASAGGPIIKDRTFLFGNYEGVRQSKGVALASTVPSNVARTGTLYQAGSTICTTDGGTFNSTTGVCTVPVSPAAAQYLTFWPQAPASAQIAGQDTAQFAFAGQQVLNEDFFTIRGDHKISEHDSMFGTFFRDNANFSGPDGLDQVLNGHHINRKAVIVEETHIFSTSLLNAIRFGYNTVGAYDNRSFSAINPMAANKSLASTPGMNAARVNVSGVIANFNGGVGGLDSFLNDWKSFQVYDDASLTHKTHSIKFGFAFERMHNGVTGYGNPAGNWNFNTLADFLTNNAFQFSSALSSATPRNVRQSIFGVYFQDDWRVRSNLTLNLGLRYEMSTVPTEVNGKLSSLHHLTDPAPYCGVANPFCAGVAPLFSNPTLRNFEPRIGLVWDPFRDGKTAIRAGAGIFDVLPLPYQFVFLQYRPAPFYQLGSITGDPTKPNLNPLRGTFYNQGYSLLTSPTNLSGTFIDPHPHRNYVMQWNLNVQRQLTTNLAVLAGYVGSRGVHQQFRVDDADMNLPTLTPYGYLFPLNPPQPVLNTNFTGIRSLWWNANSSYHALVTSATKRMNHGVQFQGSFTWGKSIDNNSAGVGPDSFQNSLSSLHWYDYRLTKAVSDYNIGRTLSLSSTWQLPGFKDSGFAHWVLGGWELGGIFTAHDGMPVTPLLPGDVLHENSTDPFSFPDRVGGPGCSSLVNPGNVTNYIKLNCFTMPTAPSPTFYTANCDPTFAYPICANLRGNAGRNSIIGPGFLDFDFSLFKNIPVTSISEKFNIQFRAEFFNVLNRTSFQAPFASNVVINPDNTKVSGAGALQSTAEDSREIQFALKFVW